MPWTPASRRDIGACTGGSSLVQMIQEPTEGRNLTASHRDLRIYVSMHPCIHVSMYYVSMCLIYVSYNACYGFQRSPLPLLLPPSPARAKGADCARARLGGRSSSSVLNPKP